MKPIYRKYLKTGAVLWAVCFVALFLFYLIVLGPQEQVRRRTEQRLAEAKQQAQEATEAAQEKTKARLAQQVEQASATLERFVIAEKRTDNLPLDIGEIPGREQFGDWGISADEALIPMNNCKQIFGKRLSVNFTSSFNEFATFLSALERNRPVVFVDTFSIIRGRDETSRPQVTMELAILVEKQAGAKEG